MDSAKHTPHTPSDPFSFDNQDRMQTPPPPPLLTYTPKQAPHDASDGK